MSSLSYVSEGKGKVGLRPSRSAIKRVGLALALTLGVAGAADVGYDYVTTGRYLETTDDAYVKADSTIIAPKVSGYVAEVAVSDNEPVKADQLLARIDDRISGRRWTRPGQTLRLPEPPCATSMHRLNCSSR